VEPDRPLGIFQMHEFPAVTGTSRMKSKVVVEGQERTFVLILEPGEEAFRSITKFADRESITGASVTAIGDSLARSSWLQPHSAVGRF